MLSEGVIATYIGGSIGLGVVTVFGIKHYILARKLKAEEIEFIPEEVMPKFMNNIKIELVGMSIMTISAIIRMFLQ